MPLGWKAVFSVELMGFFQMLPTSGPGRALDVLCGLASVGGLYPLPLLGC